MNDVEDRLRYLLGFGKARWEFHGSTGRYRLSFIEKTEDGIEHRIAVESETLDDAITQALGSVWVWVSEFSEGIA